jgi:dolichyl-phosphate-mannose--protein O-mannosyl transferase
MAAISCYPETKAPLNYFSTMLLSFISALFFREAIKNHKTTAVDNMMMLISGLFFVIIFTSPLNTGIKCYAEIIGLGDNAN